MPPIIVTDTTVIMETGEEIPISEYDFGDNSMVAELLDIIEEINYDGYNQ